MSNETHLVCNTGRCTQRIEVTPELRPHIEISEGGIHSLSHEVAGKCPKCGATSGFVDTRAANFANELSQMFQF